MRLFVPEVSFWGWGCYFDSLVDPGLFRLLISSWFWIGKSQISKYLSLLNNFWKMIASIFWAICLWRSMYCWIDFSVGGRRVWGSFFCHFSHVTPTLLYVWSSIVSLLLNGLCHCFYFLYKILRHIVSLIF